MTTEELKQKINDLQQENTELRNELSKLKPSQTVAQDKQTSQPPKVSPPPTRIPSPWSGSVALGGSLDRGNSRDENINIKAELDRTTKADKLTNSIEGDFGRSTGVTSTERAIEATQYDYNIDERLYALVHEASTFDHLAGVEYRGVLGPGLGYYFFKTKRYFFNVELGVVGQVQKLQSQAFQETPRGLLADNFEYKFSDATRIFGNAEVLPDLVHPADYLFDGHINLETQVYKQISFRFSINDLFNSRAPLGFQYNDLNAVTALVWKF